MLAVVVPQKYKNAMEYANLKARRAEEASRTDINITYVRLAMPISLVLVDFHFKLSGPT
jgi:hypothetical protein